MSLAVRAGDRVPDLRRKNYLPIHDLPTFWH